MSQYIFNISLSILNHLGRNLYRSFITVLGEAISNAWDADAQRVDITIDRDKNILVIKDNGRGMTDDDFQNKFLKIGYSKRKEGVTKTPAGRPFIGRKGIGKLALLSCAKKITVLTKTENTDWIGGVIDNSGLDEAIKDDVSASDYKLSLPDESIVGVYKGDLTSGTVIVFENINNVIRNRVEYIRKLVALYFRFSLHDSNFEMFLNETRITMDELGDLVDSTQFLWKINDLADPYVTGSLEGSQKLRKKEVPVADKAIRGFIASVEKPSNLKISGSDEKVGIDLFVNGRLREKDILRHISTARVVESYLYGQIHYDALDDESDRFTSSREGVVSDDPMFKGFLDQVREVVQGILEDWDDWRVDLNQDGDAENKQISRRERKSRELFGEVAKEYIASSASPSKGDVVSMWVKELAKDAEFNIPAYAECFVSENLLRKYIEKNEIELSEVCKNKAKKWRKESDDSRNIANISFKIREKDTDIYYLDMDSLAELIEDPKMKHEKQKHASLLRDANEYKPIRDAMGHTSLLTKEAQDRLNMTYQNIRARIIRLLNGV